MVLVTTVKCRATGLGVGEHMLELIQDLFRTGIANPAWTANALDALVHREREGSVRLLSEVGHPVSHGVPQSPQRVGYRLQARPDHRSATVQGEEGAVRRGHARAAVARHGAPAWSPAVRHPPASVDGYTRQRSGQR